MPMRVSVTFPTSASHGCCGTVDRVRPCEQDLQRLNPAEQERQKTEVYVCDSGNSAPTVVTFTSEAATMAVNELLAGFGNSCRVGRWTRQRYRKHDKGFVRGVGCRIPPDTRLCMGHRLMPIRAKAGIAPVFLELCLNSPWIADFAVEKTTGAAAPRVNMSLVRDYSIPLPSLAEQHRIVARVDALMAICDRLESAFSAADNIRAGLLKALPHEALEPAAEAVTVAGE